MQLEIITPDKRVYEGEVKLVKVPGSKGSFEILRNHAPIISTLNEGKIKVVDQSDEISYFDIGGGIIEVRHNHIIILVESV